MLGTMLKNNELDLLVFEVQRKNEILDKVIPLKDLINNEIEILRRKKYG